MSTDALPVAAAHEQFDRFPAAPALSGRAFGLTIALALAILGLAPLRHTAAPRWWALSAAAGMAAIALVRGSLFQPVAAVWSQLLRPINAAVAVVAMGLLFVLVIVPVGLIRRLVVKDPLELRKNPGASSYWKRRSASMSVSGSMADQF